VSVLNDNGADLHSLAMRPEVSIQERTKSFRPLNQADRAGDWRLVIRVRRRQSLWAAWDGIGHVAQAGVQWGSLSHRDPRSGLLRASWGGDDGWFARCHHDHAVAELWRAVHH